MAEVLRRASGMVQKDTPESVKAAECLEMNTGTPSVLPSIALRERVDSVRTTCLAQDSSVELRLQTGALPFTIAFREKDAAAIQLTYETFGDRIGVGSIRAALTGLSEAQCCNSGEVPVYNWRRDYLACRPRALALPSEEEKSRCGRN
jgi:hypothetical protein